MNVNALCLHLSLFLLSNYFIHWLRIIVVQRAYGKRLISMKKRTKPFLRQILESSHSLNESKTCFIFWNVNIYFPQLMSVQKKRKLTHQHQHHYVYTQFHVYESERKKNYQRSIYNEK